MGKLTLSTPYRVLSSFVGIFTCVKLHNVDALHSSVKREGLPKWVVLCVQRQY